MKAKANVSKLGAVSEPICSVSDSSVLDFKMRLKGTWVSLPQRIDVKVRPIEGVESNRQEWTFMERWNIGGERGLMIAMLLIGFLFGIVTLSVIPVVRYLTCGTGYLSPGVIHLALNVYAGQYIQDNCDNNFSGGPVLAYLGVTARVSSGLAIQCKELAQELCWKPVDQTCQRVNNASKNGGVCRPSLAEFQAPTY